uniref:Probable proton-coupled zinc antiporter SLC30A3 n=1 Tax=Terrapene triunguis TaxID=2587831 RepID=A0A674II30_9SAUR
MSQGHQGPHLPSLLSPSRAGLSQPGVPWAVGTGVTFALTPLCLSLFTGSREPFPGLPPETSPVAPSLELERRLARHCHRSPRTPSQSRAEPQACRKLGIACAICFVFMIGEVVGGYLAHSLAIMTDAAHLLADVGSMSVSLFSLWVSARPPTKTMTFGWHRSETLGALASVLSIWVVTGVLVYLASARIISNDYEIDARAMLVTSACAVGINVIMAYILHQSVTGHGHARGYEKMEESPGCCAPPGGPPPGSTSVRAAFVHVVGDLLQSLGVLTAATVIYVEPRYKIADPVSTFLFSVFVLGSTVTILRDVFRVLMEGELGGHGGHGAQRSSGGCGQRLQLLGKARGQAGGQGSWGRGGWVQSRGPGPGSRAGGRGRVSLKRELGRFSVVKTKIILSYGSHNLPPD